MGRHIAMLPDVARTAPAAATFGPRAYPHGLLGISPMVAELPIHRVVNDVEPTRASPLVTYPSLIIVASTAMLNEPLHCVAADDGCW